MCAVSFVVVLSCDNRVVQGVGNVVVCVNNWVVCGVKEEILSFSLKKVL